MTTQSFTIAPQRSVRVENELWEPAMARASREDDTLSQVIRRFLAEYRNGNDTMFIAKTELLRQKAEAWDHGHSAGFDDGSVAEVYARDGELGYERGSEPVLTRNPYNPAEAL